MVNLSEIKYKHKAENNLGKDKLGNYAFLEIRVN